MIQHHLSRLIAVDCREAFPWLRLRRLDETQHQCRIERPPLVVAVLGRAAAVIHKDIAPLRGQVVDDGVFKPGFGVYFHDAHVMTSTFVLSNASRASPSTS